MNHCTDPRGDGSGGTSIHGLVDSTKSSQDVTKSQHRFLQSQGRFLRPNELNRKGVVIAMEMSNVPNTIGSQFLITLSDDNGLKDMVPIDEMKTGMMDGEDRVVRYLSLGQVVEDDQDVLSKLNRSYCDDEGRPYADIRIERILLIHDAFEDSEGMSELLKARGVELNESPDDADQDYSALAPKSPDYERPNEEVVSHRIQADDTTLFATEYHDEEEEDEETRQKRIEMQQKQEEEWKQRQDTSRAVMLEMLGDLPSAEIRAPENVLFVCKLNPLTNDEDLELIFSRFDQNAKAEIIRDPDTGDSLQYAFVEFTSNEACNEAYLKMNNALVDDRRIKVDFSQSVAKVWDRYHKRYRQGLSGGVELGYRDGRGDGGRGRGRGRGRGGRGSNDFRGRGNGYDGRHSQRNDSRGNWNRDTSNGNRDHMQQPERMRRESRSNSPNGRIRSRSYSPERRHNNKRSRSPSSRSRSMSSSVSRHRKKHKKKHGRHHDRKHHHHSKKEKKRKKKHRHRSRSRDRRHSRSSSPRQGIRHRDDTHLSHLDDDDRKDRKSRRHDDDRRY